MNMIPGMGNKLRGQDLSVNEDFMQKTKAMIQSMTPEERSNPDIIKGNRKKRICLGSGTTIQDLNQLLRQFDSARDMMKKMAKNKRGGLPF